MSSDESAVLEVKSGVITDFEGAETHVSGGVWYSPEAWLASEAKLRALREKSAQQERSIVPVVVGAAFLGAAIGYWLARDRD